MRRSQLKRLLVLLQRLRLTMASQPAAIWATFICTFVVVRAGIDGREPPSVAGDSSPDAQSAGNTIVYCQPLPTVAPHGVGSEHHVGNGRKPTPTKIGKGHAGKVQQHDYAEGNENGHAYEKDGKYWLVPPFLIGASSIVVIYVFVHCMYTHCSCADDKQRRRRPGAPGGPMPIRRVQITTAAGMTTAMGGNGRGPTIVLSDSAGAGGNGGGSTNAASGSRLVPLVCYDDASAATGSGSAAGGGLGSAYGRTQLVEAQPFLIYEQCDDSLDYYEEQPPTPRKGSGFLQLPAAIGRRLSQARLSFSSIGRGSHGRDREPRASLCFLPVARTISDPSGVPGDCVANGSIGGGIGGGSGQTRFETFYCRTCGCHNIIDIGSSVSAAAAVSTAKLISPDGDAAGIADSKQDIDGIGSSSSPPPQLTTAAAFPVPTILVDDEDAMMQSASENDAECIVNVGADNIDGCDTAIVIVTEDC